MRRESARWAGLIAGLGLGLAGCVVDNVAADYRPDAAGGNGVVVAALGRTGAIEFDLYAQVTPVGGGRTRTLVVDNNATPKDFGKVVQPPAVSQASDWGYVPAGAPLERMVVASLPAGDYEFARLSGAAPRFSGSHPNRFSISSDPIGLKFSVKPGQVTYLGSVVFGFPDWLAQAHYFGPLRVVTADTRERDAAWVRQRYPQLSGELPGRSMAEATGTRDVRYYLYREDDGNGKD